MAKDKKTLLIVESPAKCKKIQGYLGSNYIVKASYGHIRDLEKGNKAIDKENNFEPTYILSPDKKDVVKELKDAAKKVDFLILASDNDREGESISWHIKEVLGLKENEYDRITFNEITEKAIKEALKNPRKIDVNLANSQQGRRILDRLVGFSLSPILWKKVQPKLSAGRVQSVVLRIVVDREKEINKFESGSDFKVVALFENTDNKNGKSIAFKAILNKRFKEKKQAEDFLKKCIGQNFSVKSIETKPGKKSPSAPFTTSTLQQEASRKLGFSVDRTMSTAQKLYEAGHNSYHRTDATILSEEIMTATKAEVVKLYGANYSNSQQYKTKSKSAQEAHEAIRPTHIENQTISGDSDQQRLYELIWKRTTASQMSDAQVERTTVTIGSKDIKEDFIAKGEVLKFDGFLKVYMETSDNDDNSEESDENKSLPAMTKGQSLTYQEILGIESFTKPAARYTEASLVKKMEELGIGRPSTYAQSVSILSKRGYAENKDGEAKERNVTTLTLKQNNISEVSKKENYGGEKKKLFPTEIGMIVSDFLVKNFPDVVDYGFTAKVEEELDEIAKGTKIWYKVVGDFYYPLEKLIKEVSKEEGKITEKLLGVDPITKKNVYSKYGRFGPVVQLGESLPPKEKDKTNAPKFVKLAEGQKLETLTLAEALKLLEWPKSLGKHKGEEATVAFGKWGPYIKYKEKYYSIKEPLNAETITLKEALIVIEEKDNNPTSGTVKEFKSKNIKVLKGKFGPYFTNGKKNYKIPNHIEVEKITLDECLEIIKNFKPYKKKES